MYLNCKTFFSFRYGTYSAKELVQAASEQGITALALTNINNTCDVWDFVKACQEYHIKPIVGVEIRNGDDLLYILLAANNKGLQWINWFLSVHLREGKGFPASQDEYEGGFFYDSGDGFVVYPWGKKMLGRLRDNEYIGVRPYQINKLFGLDRQSEPSRLVILHSASFQDRARYEIHCLLRCIDKNVLFSKLSQEACGSVYEHFVAPIRLLNKFKDFPFIVTNTYRLIDACEISMQFGTDKNKKSYSANKKDDVLLLRKLAYDGLQRRYRPDDEVAAQRLEKELQIIEKLGFNSYFLIAWDLIRYARSRGFYYVGRGSGANSIVAYCLNITDVDPIELDLYFERFLNPNRTSPPDFDIDFSWLDRDEAIDYVFKRYGSGHVALLGMYSTFQYNAIVREFGKVYGLPKAEIDALGEKGYYYGQGRGGNFQKRIEEEEDSIHQKILRYGKLIDNFPNYLSIHPGGMLISEEPIYSYTATFMPPKNFATAQIDMFIAEDVGLNKIDILSQRGLGHIREAIRLVKENKQVEVRIDDVERFKKDLRVKDLIKNGIPLDVFISSRPLCANCWPNCAVRIISRWWPPVPLSVPAWRAAA
jgi:DNA polymerase-3 subunit alpha